MSYTTLAAGWVTAVFFFIRRVQRPRGVHRRKRAPGVSQCLTRRRVALRATRGDRNSPRDAGVRSTDAEPVPDDHPALQHRDDAGRRPSASRQRRRQSGIRRAAASPYNPAANNVDCAAATCNSATGPSLDAWRAHWTKMPSAKPSRPHHPRHVFLRHRQDLRRRQERRSPCCGPSAPWPRRATSRR